MCRTQCWISSGSFLLSDPLQSFGFKYPPYAADSWYTSLVQNFLLNCIFTQQLWIWHFHCVLNLHLKKNRFLFYRPPFTQVSPSWWKQFHFFHLLRKSSWNYLFCYASSIISKSYQVFSKYIWNPTTPDLPSSKYYHLSPKHCNNLWKCSSHLNGSLALFCLFSTKARMVHFKYIRLCYSSS